MFSVFANLINGKSRWDNVLDMGYGLLKQGNNETDKFRKTDDKVDFLSKYGREAFILKMILQENNFNTHLLYDDNILIAIDRNDDGNVSGPEDIPGKRVQFKEIFGVGFSYKF